MREMYCSQCGKKVMNTMLFCPFCGSPIVITEQDEVKPAAAEKFDANNTAVVAEENLFADAQPAAQVVEEEPRIKFVPLDMNLLWNEHTPEKESEENDETSENEAAAAQAPKEAIRLQGRRPDLSAERVSDAPKKTVRKTAEDTVSQHKFDPEDIFFDDEDEDEDFEDDFDDFEDDFDDELDDDELDDFDFEEPESGSFFVRHIRGFVALIMFVIVAAVLTGWALSSSGQRALARNGFAWKPGVYVEIALEAYQNGSYSLAGRYYSEAFERDAERYEYANSAGVAYYMANDVSNAETMARKAVEVDPSRMEAYELLLRLYPSADARPQEIQAILQNGYQITGNDLLKPTL